MKYENNETVVEWNSDLMLEVSLNEPDDFLKVKETLTRIGVSSNKDGRNKLYQSCHILHKQGRYFIVHFKELFHLDGKPSNLTENDIGRRNTIATLLSDWGLVSLVKVPLSEMAVGVNQLKIVSFAQKKNYELVTKYSIGRRH